MAKRRTRSATTAPRTHGKGMFVFGGIVSIILGLALLFGWLDLTVTFGIVFVLMGIHKFMHGNKCC